MLQSIKNILFQPPVGRGGALVESIAFNRRVVALRCETPAQYPCCVGSASQYRSGLEEALWKWSLWM